MAFRYQTPEHVSTATAHYRGLSGRPDLDLSGMAMNPATGTRQMMYARTPNDPLTEDYSDFRFDNPGFGYQSMAGMRPGFYADNDATTFDNFMERGITGGLVALGALASGGAMGYGPAAEGAAAGAGASEAAMLHAEMAGGAYGAPAGSSAFAVEGMAPSAANAAAMESAVYGTGGVAATSALPGTASPMTSFSPVAMGAGDMFGAGEAFNAGTAALGGSSFMNFAPAIMSLASGAFGLDAVRRLRNRGQDAMERSDPFGPHRAQYAQMLNDLYMNPDRVTQLPGYQAGLTAVERKMASQGYLGSGNMMLALHEHGGKMFNDEAARLAMLAGAGMKPDVDAMMRGETGSSELLSQSLGSAQFGMHQLLPLIMRSYNG